MNQLVHLLLAIDTELSTSKRVSIRLGLGGLNKVYEPNHPTPAA